MVAVAREARLEIDVLRLRRSPTRGACVRGERQSGESAKRKHRLLLRTDWSHPALVSLAPAQCEALYALAPLHEGTA